MKHITVLQHEAVEGLSIAPDDVVFDATYGSGGHAREILSRLSASGTYIGVDADNDAFQNLPPEESKATMHLVHDNFRNITQITRSLHIEYVNAILADLGWRSEQFAEGNKGFSFQNDEPLLMTFGDPEHYPFTAYDIVNTWEEHVLANIIFGYAEERFARRIAKKIIEHRSIEPITTTSDLVAVIKEAIPRKAQISKINPATKTFQALRIAVNDELGALEQLLNDGFSCLAPQGKMAIITFHSIEDRIVKQTFRNLVAQNLATLTPKKFVSPTTEEIEDNPRARSAKLRIITKT